MSRGTAENKEKPGLGRSQVCNYPLATQNIAIKQLPAQLPAQASQPEQGTELCSGAGPGPSMGTPPSCRALRFPKSLNISANPKAGAGD